MKAAIPPPIVFFICAALMWLIDAIIPSRHFDFAYRNVLFWIVVLTGFGVLIAGAANIFSRKTTIRPDRKSLSKATALISTGAFRYSRNPLYLGLSILLVAWMIFLANVLTVVGVIVFVMFITEYQIKPEEEELEKIFGEEYLRYKRNVRRWI